VEAVLAEACASLVGVESRDDHVALLLHGAAWEGRRGLWLASPAPGG
jgi:hypothetical protein